MKRFTKSYLALIDECLEPRKHRDGTVAITDDDESLQAFGLELKTLFDRSGPGAIQACIEPKKMQTFLFGPSPGRFYDDSARNVLYSDSTVYQDVLQRLLTIRRPRLRADAIRTFVGQQLEIRPFLDEGIVHYLPPVHSWKHPTPASLSRLSPHKPNLRRPPLYQTSPGFPDHTALLALHAFRQTGAIPATSWEPSWESFERLALQRQPGLTRAEKGAVHRASDALELLQAAGLDGEIWQARDQKPAWVLRHRANNEGLREGLHRMVEDIANAGDEEIGTVVAAARESIETEVRAFKQERVRARAILGMDFLLLGGSSLTMSGIPWFAGALAVRQVVGPSTREAIRKSRSKNTNHPVGWLFADRR